MVTMMQNKRYLINFTFYETVRDEPIPHKNFTLLVQGSHESPPPPPPVSDVGTNTLGNRRVNDPQNSLFIAFSWILASNKSFDNLMSQNFPMQTKE